MNKLILLFLIIPIFLIAQEKQSASKLDQQQQNQEDYIPEPDEFTPCEKQPMTDYNDLIKLVKYPELAKKAGIEGKVFVKVLVSNKGKAVKTIIVQSDNDLLNQASIDAVNKAKWTPAVQKGENIYCWVTVPINYKLKDMKKDEEEGNKEGK